MPLVGMSPLPTGFLTPERSHPRTGLLQERPRPNDADAFPRTETSNVVRDEEAGTRADRGGHDRNVFRISQATGAFSVPRAGTVDPDCDGSQELLEERARFRKLRCQVMSNLLDSRLGQHYLQEADFAQDQDRVARPATREKASDEHVSVQANGNWVSLLALGHPDP